MKLPRSLYVGYNLLKKSRVAVKKENDEEALVYFQNILNEAQPSTPDDILLHKFVKGMYNENKYKFLSFIKNTSHECLVLWTESKAIINYLGLRGVVYVKWTGKETLYSVSQFHSTTAESGANVETSYEHPLVRRQRMQKETKSVEVKSQVKEEDPVVGEADVPKSDTPVAEPEKADDDLPVLSLTRMASVSVSEPPKAWGDMESDND